MLQLPVDDILDVLTIEPETVDEWNVVCVVMVVDSVDSNAIDVDFIIGAIKIVAKKTFRV